MIGKPTTGRPKKYDVRSGRDHKICIRVSSVDIRRLEKLCEYYGMTKTDIIIQAIANQYEVIRREEKE